MPTTQGERREAAMRRQMADDVARLINIAQGHITGEDYADASTALDAALRRLKTVARK